MDEKTQVHKLASHKSNHENIRNAIAVDEHPKVHMLI